MRVEETCSCGASVVIVDEIRIIGTPRDYQFDLEKRVTKRLDDWRATHNHDMRKKKVKK